MRIHYEKIALPDYISINVRKVNKDSFSSPLHFHPEIELTLIEEGSGSRVIGDNISIFGRGDLILLGSNLPHFWSNKNEKLIKGTRSRALVVQFKKEFLGNDFFNKPEMQHLQKLLLLSSRGIQITGKTKNMVVKFMNRMTKENPFHKVIFLLSVLDLIANSEEITILSNEGFCNYTNHNDSERINKVYKYISENLETNLSVNHASQLLRMTISSFCHYFKKKTHKTFTQAVTEMRIGYANRLLIETDMNISEICYASGFNSLSNFNKQFKKVCNSSPSEFREKALKI